ncbi:MAG: transcription-repair coupling factor [Syntrophales bacterium]
MSAKDRILPDSLHDLIGLIRQGEKSTILRGLGGSAKALILSFMQQELRRPIVAVCPTQEAAKNLCKDLSLFAGGDNVVFYPPWDILTMDIFASQRGTELQRIAALVKLFRKEPSIYVVPLQALLQKVIPADVIGAHVRTISMGDILERDAFVAALEASGYLRVPIVEEEGEYSVRGHVIDVYAPGAANPFRMIFIGDELESIKEFDAVSQRSILEKVDFVLPPARELILSAGAKKRALRNLRVRANDLGLSRIARDRLEEIIENDLSASINPVFMPLYYTEEENGGRPHVSPGVLTDYFPEQSILFFFDRLETARAEEKISGDLDRVLDKAAREGKFYPEKDAFYVSGSDIFPRLRKFQTLHVEELEVGDGGSEIRAVQFDIETDLGLRREPVYQEREESILAPLVEKVRGWLGQGNLVAFLCAGDEGVQRIAHLLESYTLPISKTDDSLLSVLGGHNGKGRFVLREGRITEGFLSAGLKFVVFSDEDIFGRKVRRKRAKPAREGYFLKSFGELKDGDYVVHTEHGIGAYRGLEKLEVGNIENDFLVVEYLGGDKLYIPVDRLDQIQRYIGPDGHVPRIDKLGGTSWDAAKRKVKRSVEEIAEELVALYAAREVMERHAFLPTDKYYDEFASSFDYEETQDQAKAIEEINRDMDDSRPMDRLVCGDAGFGKTEVAVRAAFRAAMEGKQVAVLVPTTILAEQHYQTFSRRFEKYPVRIEVLNRFKSKIEQSKILEDVKKGSVEILIGTHRLLQDDVVFKNLGLVVIDEEQRFGVNHKEKFKKLRTLVDVLALSATPIPRTLELSLVGLRDLSVINTPPRDRHEIKTYVMEFDKEAIRDAIRRELARGGQVFFVHDRIHSIEGIARLIRRLVPEAAVITAHGRMRGRELEDVMVKFVRKDYNVLICTTIIGSGIDIPSANTIIINRADRLGLSQLYQLRGRVGRSKSDAYAYLLIPGGAVLSHDAQKRLRVIKEFTEPGSGFKIAAHDLEIRGAGNLLGSSQSGHIAAVGYELYIELMEKTIRELKGEMPSAAEEVRPEIHLGIPAFIPEDYIPDMNRRLTVYKRISMADSDSDLDGIREELMDTCGFIAPQVENLLQVISIRNMLKGVLGRKMEYDGKRIFIAFHEKSPVDPAKILRLIRSEKATRFTPDLRLHVEAPGLCGEEIIREARHLLSELIN